MFVLGETRKNQHWLALLVPTSLNPGAVPRPSRPGADSSHLPRRLLFRGVCVPNVHTCRHGTTTCSCSRHLGHSGFIFIYIFFRSTYVCTSRFGSSAETDAVIPWRPWGELGTLYRMGFRIRKDTDLAKKCGTWAFGAALNVRAEPRFYMHIVGRLQYRLRLFLHVRVGRPRQVFRRQRVQVDSPAGECFIKLK